MLPKGVLSSIYKDIGLEKWKRKKYYCLLSRRWAVEMVRLPSCTDTQSYKHTHAHTHTHRVRTHTYRHAPLQNLLKVLPITIITYFKYDKQSWVILISFLFFFPGAKPGPFSVFYIHVISSLISSEAKLALWFYLITRKIFCQGWGFCASLGSALPSAVTRTLAPASPISSTSTVNCRLDAWKLSGGKGEVTIQLSTTFNKDSSAPFFTRQLPKMQEIYLCGAFGGSFLFGLVCLFSWVGLVCFFPLFLFVLQQIPRLYSLPY